MTGDREADRLRDICSRVGEHFQDYVVIIRTEDGNVSWRASDPTWAEGAARRFFNYVQTANHFSAMDEFNRRIE